MKESLNYDKLKEVIELAEKELEEIKNKKGLKNRLKRHKITKALESAYKILNDKNKQINQSFINKGIEKVLFSLTEVEPLSFMIIYLLGTTLSGLVVFTSYQAYSLIENQKDYNDVYNVTQEVSDLVEVNYTENNIVSLYDQMSVSDEKGLKNKPQEFTISNNSEKIKTVDYLVNYTVNLVPMNDPSAHLLDKKYISYRYTYTKDDGTIYESPIGSLDELKENDDGTLLLTKNVQKKDEKTDFKVVFWINSLATNDEQGATYTFAFKVNAAIAGA